MIRFLLALVLFVVTCGPTAAQNIPLLHYDVESGLPSNMVYYTYRDSKGYLWVATDKGIARFNGVKFEVFTTFNGLPDNEIFTMEEDAYGRLWMGCFNGELCYYKDGTFHTAANTPFLRLPLNNCHITEIVAERDKSVTILFNRASQLLNIKGERISIVDFTNTTTTKGIFYCSKKYQEEKYVLLLSDTNRTRHVVVDSSGKIVQEYPDMYCKYDFWIRPLHNQDQRYVMFPDTIYSTDMLPLTSYNNPLKLINAVHNIYLDEHNIFYATRHGLIINDSIVIKPDLDITSIVNDNKGHYWIGTLERGLYCFNTDLQANKIYEKIYTESILNVFSVNNQLFFTTANNDLYSFFSGTVKKLINYSGSRPKYDFPNQPFVFIDHNGRYYDLYNNDNVIIDGLLSGKMIKRSCSLPGAFFCYGFKNIVESNGKIYLQKWDRITKYDLSAPLRPVLPVSDIKSTVKDQRVFNMAPDKDGHIWYASFDKVYKLADNDDATEQPFFSKMRLKYFRFFGNYMIGYTQRNKLTICNMAGNNYYVDSAIRPGLIWGEFYKLDDTHIIIATNDLYHLLTLYSSPGKPSFSLNPIENPFIPLRAEKIAADSNNCYFFKDGSITSVPLRKLLQKTEPPELYFSFLKTNYDVYPAVDGMEIVYNESRNLSIVFSALSLNARNITYQYSLSADGRDNWRDLDGNKINLINPLFGRYILKVRAHTMASDVSVPVQMTFTILRPFWASWWFITGLGLIIVGAVTLLVRYRLQWVLRKREQKHDAEMRFIKSEYKALNALMNPHFIFNALNNVQSLINEDKKLTANRYLRIFANLIRQNMSNVSKELISLQDEMNLVNNYLLLEKLRFEERFTYEVRMQDNVDADDIMVPPLLIQPLVENSIKHGVLELESDDGIIRIEITNENDVLKITVKDNGVGMQASSRKPGHESYGLSNIRKRIEQLGIIQDKKYSLDIGEDVDATGRKWTSVIITIPMQ